LVDPSVSVVTITVTEHGYCSDGPGGALDLSRPEIVHDLHTPHAPRSLPGLLLEALARRRTRGTAPFAITSCDNLPANGAATARVVFVLADHVDPRLAAWIRGNVAFPSSMVDRMVPATTPSDQEHLRRQGIVDAWPVVTEPFSQWVLEDVFPHGRPPWERAGVELVPDVTRHEQAKLRIFNAAHSALAYWGLLAGHPLVADAVADAVLLTATRQLLTTEVLPTLDAPPGWDLECYAKEALARFANRALAYTVAKVAGDGSQKLPIRLMPTIRARLADGTAAPLCSLLLAAWVACMIGPRSSTFAVDDAALVSLNRQPEDDIDARAAALLDLPGFPSRDQATERSFRADVIQQAIGLGRGDVRAVLTDTVARAAAPRLTAADI
jgi:fructuronate reductase